MATTSTAGIDHGHCGWYVLRGLYRAGGVGSRARQTFSPDEYLAPLERAGLLEPVPGTVDDVRITDAGYAALAQRFGWGAT